MRTNSSSLGLAIELDLVELLLEPLIPVASDRGAAFEFACLLWHNEINSNIRIRVKKVTSECF